MNTLDFQVLRGDTLRGPSFSFANRALRVVWALAYYCAFRFTPPPLHFWRAAVLRCFGAKVGHNVHIYPGVKIWAPWNLTCEDECGIASGVTLYSQAKIVIGRRSVISQGTYICTGTHDYEDPEFPLRIMPVEIGPFTWLAANCFIHPGVIVGAGAVVAACSVVKKNVPEWTVCGGNPCVQLKPRCCKEVILAYQGRN